jgi:Uma2 family endonuclease
VVTCTAVPRGADVLVAPIVVFEILSKSTASVDRIVKNDEYGATPSIQHYVMLEQSRIGATVFSRDAEGWTGRVLTADATLDLPAIGMSVALAAFYAGVVFDRDNEE